MNQSKRPSPHGFYYVGAELRRSGNKVINGRLLKDVNSKEEAEVMLEQIKAQHPNAAIWHYFTL